MLLNEELKNKRVLVIGDSFTDILSTSYSWLNRLRVHYNWSVDNRSVTGSGSDYTFYEFMHNTQEFDICILAWSEPDRLFIPAAPYLNSSEVQLKKLMQPWQKDIYRAAQHYYIHLRNEEMIIYKNVALLHWFDEYLSKNYNDKIFLHFHSFPKPDINDNVYTSVKDTDTPNLYHTFETGLNITPSLLKLSVTDPDAPEDFANDTRPGHLSKRMHERLFYGLIEHFKKHTYTDNNIINLGR